LVARSVTLKRLVITLAVAACARLGGAAGSESRFSWCGTRPDAARDALLIHAERTARYGDVRGTRVRSAFDVGEIAVVQDEGDLAVFRNPLDLQGAGIRFTPQSEGFSVSRLSLPLSTDAGDALPLQDDDTRPVALPFAFSFYGSSHTQVFVNSDGNLTFGSGDRSSSARTLSRLVNGAPRIAPLLSDLDPSAGGRVTAAALGDRLTVTWTQVPQFERTDKNTFQVTLWADGRIDFVYGSELSTNIAEGVVGIAPGSGTGGVTAVDFSSSAGVSGPAALAESFNENDDLDTVAVARKFYATHRDDYDELVVFTNRRLVASGTFAYEQTVSNSDAGIGDDIFNFSSRYGSAGRLQSFVMMDNIAKYPEDLEQRFLGEDSALAVLAHEVGHRWLAKARFRDSAATSSEMLGRGDVHWSFFLDTDGSHLEGNDIEETGTGQFRTSGAGLRYSPLDQYLMGLRPAGEVPPFFVVRQPAGTDTNPGRDPRNGVAFSGTRKDITIEDVIAALGPRNPPPGPKTTPLRQAYVFVSVGPPDANLIARVDRFRVAFEAYFERSTERRHAVSTRLN
jgi:hypothetical protein